MKKVTLIVLSFLALTLSTQSIAARGNTPCSRGKGGVDYCSGGKFICKDGTVSRSAKRCGR